MIGITDDAKKELKKIIAENAGDPGMSLRLAASEEGQLGLVMDTQLPGDEVVEYDGTKVLLVEEHLSTHLGGISLEVQDTPEGPMLMLRQEGCGPCCGGGESGCGGGTCGDGDKCH
jgi:Fe-S cluster assembly iron-binding protein IscA